MPKVKNYQKGSVIFFEGEVKRNEIFLIRSGEVVLTQANVENNSININAVMKKGEFFGIESVMGNYNRQETARVKEDVLMLVFRESEFEHLLSQKKKITSLLLKKLSNDLRKIGNRLERLLSNDEDTKNNNKKEESLYKLGQFYLSKKRFSHARYVFERYIQMNPENFIQNVYQLLEIAKASETKQLDEDISKNEIYMVIQDEVPKKENTADKTTEISAYEKIKQFLTNKNWLDAVSLYKNSDFQLSEDQEMFMDYHIGFALLEIKKYRESIQKFKKLITKHPNTKYLKDCLYHLGIAHFILGNKIDAISVLKILINMLDNKMLNNGDELRRKVKELLIKIEKS